MDFDERVLERDIQQYVVTALNYIVLSVQTLIPIVSTFGQTHPRLFLALTFFVVLYFTWSLINNLFRLIRRLFYIYIVLLIIAVYLRGVDQFFTQDVPLICTHLSQNAQFWWKSKALHQMKQSLKYTLQELAKTLD